VGRFPDVSTAGAAVPASIFARLREHLARALDSGIDFIPLQIGDTHLAPASRLEHVGWADLPPADLYAYGSPEGYAPLIDALVAKAARRNGIAVTRAGVQITVGATHALDCAVQGLCNPGDELVLLTPHWPLIKGMALGHHVTPVEIPMLPAGPALAERIEAAITPRTAAIYYATPNNPDGAMLARADVAAIVDIAARHKLWILADEVYEDYAYDGEHVSAAALPGGAERTVTVFSFTKSYAQAGIRVGYVLGPDPVIAMLKKLVNHSVYNVAVAMQRAALGALTDGAAFLADARTRYRDARDRARARLVAPADLPPGGAYLWVDFRRWSGDTCMPVLERVAAAGVLLAPGTAFGDACGAFARLCFTGVPPDRLDEGIDRINTVLAGMAR
jgi:aspartate/methionine/tyrosine aminotransferase